MGTVTLTMPMFDIPIKGLMLCGLATNQTVQCQNEHETCPDPCSGGDIGNIRLFESNTDK
jgi:hypothetical protein